MACPGCKCGMAEIEKARRVDRVEIRPIDKNKLMDAGNTMIILNGQEIRNPRSLELKVTDQGVGIVKIELYANVVMDQSIVKDAEIQGACDDHQEA